MQNNMSVFSIHQRAFSLNKNFLFQVHSVPKPNIVEPRIEKVSSGVISMTGKLRAERGYITYTPTQLADGKPGTQCFVFKFVLFPNPLW